MKTLKEIIVEHPFFLGMKPAHLEVLAGCAGEQKLKAGDMLFREGEPASQFYLIGLGQIALEAHEPANGTLLVQTLGPGDVLGWSWLFPPFTWHFQARAVESSRLIVFNGARLLATAEKDPEFGYELMKRISQVVIRRLQVTRKKLLEQQIEAALDG